MTKQIESIFGNLNDEQLQLMKSGIKEISDRMSVIDGQKEGIKDILDSLFNELQVPKKILRKLAKTYHNKNYSEILLENSEFQTLYEEIVNSNDIRES